MAALHHLDRRHRAPPADDGLAARAGAAITGVVIEAILAWPGSAGESVSPTTASLRECLVRALAVIRTTQSEPSRPA